MEGTKNVVKAMKKVVQGRVKEEGQLWFIQLRDKRKVITIHLDSS